MSSLYYTKQNVLKKGWSIDPKNIPILLLRNFYDLTKTQSFSSHWWLKLIFSFRIVCIQGMTVQIILTLTNALTYPFFPFPQCCQSLSAVTVHLLPVKKKKRIKINSPLPSFNLILLFGLSASSHTHTTKFRQNRIHVHKITHQLLFQVLLEKEESLKQAGNEGMRKAVFLVHLICFSCTGYSVLNDLMIKNNKLQKI